MEDRTLRVLEFDKIISRLGNYAAGSIAKEKISELWPETNTALIKVMLSDTTDGVNMILRKSNPPLGCTKDVRMSAQRADKGAILTPGELLAIADVLRGIRQLKSYANDDRGLFEGNSVSGLISLLVTHKTIEDKIFIAIVSEEEISDFASPALGKIRRQIKDLQASVKDRLSGILKSSKSQKFMQDALVTIRGDRYVIPVKSEYKNEFPGIVHDMSSSGATMFIEPMVVVEANNEVKKARIKEEQEIERILSELSAGVAEFAEDIISDVKLVGEIDFIFAKAKLSLDMNGMSPTISETEMINIKKGRHPLIDKKVVVPIDIWLGNEFNLLVVTGPNTGGKTVTLKTVGLLTLMAQAGLHIPANDGSKIRVFNKIFADIGDEQSIEQSLSTFSSHMKNIVNIIKEVDERSLALFDELGAGTDPTEGAALATSILEYMKGKGACTMATTHYSELKIYALTTEGVENACCEFSVETLQPTYRLLIGIPGKSNAFAISSKLGLNDEIINNAGKLISEENIKFEDVLGSMEADRSRAEQEKMKAESYRIEIEKLKKEIEEEKKRFDSQKENMKIEAAKEASKIVKKAKEEADEILLRLRTIEFDTGVALEKKESEELRQTLKKKENELNYIQTENILPKRTNNKPPQNLRAGDTVNVISLGQKGTVIEPPPKNGEGEAVIQVGIMKINIHASNLELARQPVVKTPQSGATKSVSTKAKQISTQINLRGMSLDEATQELDKYIDDACITGIPSVVIVHGKGTGVLRSGIQTMLKRDSRIKSYRLGTYGEGESGVTIAELK
jgi:DNA mismatch repair protein MutS2